MITNVAKTNIRLQGHPGECGAVCLGIVLEYYGTKYSSIELRRLCSVGRDGATIAQIQQGAVTLGFQATVHKKGLKVLKDAVMPMIIHWDYNHFVVLEGLNNKYAWVNDPGLGRRKIPLDIFAQSYTGICLQLSVSELKKQEKAQAVSVWQALPSELKAVLPLVLLVLLPGTLVGVLEIFYAGISRAFFDYGVEYANTSWGILLALLGVVVVGARIFIDSSLQDYQLRQVLNLKTRFKLFFIQKLMAQPLSFFEAHYTGELLSRTYEGARFIDVCLYMVFILGESAGILLLATTVLMIQSPWVAVISLLPLITLVVWQYLAEDSFRETRIRQERDEAMYRTSVLQRVESFMRLYVMGMQKHLLVTCIPYMARAQYAAVEYRHRTRLFDAVNKTLETISYPLVTLFGCYLIIQGEMSYGAFLFTHMIAAGLTSRLKKVNDKGREYLETRPVIGKISEIINVKPEQHQALSILTPKALAAPVAEGEASDSLTVSSQIADDAAFLVQGMSFTYAGGHQLLFNQVTFQIPLGAVVVLIGQSGGGKTTLLELLSGQRDANGGEIYYRGEKVVGPITAGYVFADDEELHGDLYEYLFAAADNDEKQAREAIAIVELDQRLGFYLDSNVTSTLADMHLSRGEIQRLTLARALCHSDGVLLFDEAFSHISLSQSQRIMTRLKEKGMTIVLASHREEIQALCDTSLYINHSE